MKPWLESKGTTALTAVPIPDGLRTRVATLLKRRMMGSRSVLIPAYLPQDCLKHDVVGGWSAGTLGWEALECNSRQNRAKFRLP
jgi:hypothetical protein